MKGRDSTAAGLGTRRRNNPNDAALSAAFEQSYAADRDGRRKARMEHQESRNRALASADDPAFVEGENPHTRYVLPGHDLNDWASQERRWVMRLYARRGRGTDG